MLNKKIKKSFLRWAGSKKQMISILTELYPKDANIYFEPFLGSGALFFALNPCQSYLSDINKDLILTYQLIKKKPEEVHEVLSTFEISKSQYYQLRNINQGSISKIEQAARFIYLNRFCYNGLYRTNKSGQFNVPYAPNKTGSLPSLNDLTAISRLLQNSRIECQDFGEAIKKSKKNDFIFIDPPYLSPNKRIFQSYWSSSFTFEELNRLKHMLIELDKKGVYFLLTYIYYDELLGFFPDWNYKFIKTKRLISSNPTSRNEVTEIIISNY